MNREECFKIIADARAKGERPNLSDSDLSGANLSDSDLSGADLIGANLVCADLSDANLSGANLSRANLVDANLVDADLSDANLSGADLIGASLSRANLSRANLDFASWPLWCGGTMAKIDTRISLQLIYHAFNQDHLDKDIAAAIEVLRPLAQRFIDEYRNDATKLRED